MWSWCFCIKKDVPLSLYAPHDTETVIIFKQHYVIFMLQDTFIDKIIGDKNPMLYTIADKNSRLPIRIDKTNRSWTLMVGKQISSQMYQMFG